MYYNSMPTVTEFNCEWYRPIDYSEVYDDECGYYSADPSFSLPDSKQKKSAEDSFQDMLSVVDRSMGDQYHSDQFKDFGQDMGNWRGKIYNWREKESMETWSRGMQKCFAEIRQVSQPCNSFTMIRPDLFFRYSTDLFAADRGWRSHAQQDLFNTKEWSQKMSNVFADIRKNG